MSYTRPRSFENTTSAPVFIVVAHDGEDSYIMEIAHDTVMEATKTVLCCDVDCEIVEVPPGMRLVLERAIAP